jgi:hypothetical protein
MKSLGITKIGTLAIVALITSLSCTGGTPPVPVVGAAPEIRALAGSWIGDYSSVVTGRSGTISFELRATDDSAFGSVVMTPKGTIGPLRPWQDPKLSSGQVPIELTIRFVRITEKRISGALAPYADPSSGEPLHTTFEGTMIADTIAGTFTIRPISGASDGPTGMWRVQRTRRATSR